MKKIQQGLMTIMIATVISAYGCGPNDDKGGGDEKQGMGPKASDKEGAVDSTKIPNFDSAHAFLQTYRHHFQAS